MKLLTITTRYLLVLVFFILALWTVVFYFSLQQLVYFEIGEHLSSRTFEVKQLFAENPAFMMNSSKLPKEDFKIEEINKTAYQSFLRAFPNGSFENFMQFVPAENEEEPFRKITSVFANQANYYKITVEASLVDSKEMLQVILLNMLALSLVMAVLILFFNRLLLRRLWEPFYFTLDKIKNYRIDRDKIISFKPSTITEFKELNSSVEELIATNKNVYLQQKQFIENASHEIQTPLAIAMSKLELFMESENLSEDQAEFVKSVRNNLDRLSRLNKSLMLLSKIDNRQFEDTKWVNISIKIEDILEEYEEMIEFKKIQTHFEKQEQVQILINPDLAYILFSNLIRNAIFHNLTNGYLQIVLKKNELTIENTGKEIFVEPSKMFERFTKGSVDLHSQGLGLAIVSTICERCGFKIEYTLRENIHVISIKF